MFHPKVHQTSKGVKLYMYDFIPFEASFTIKYSIIRISIETSSRKIREIKISTFTYMKD